MRNQYDIVTLQRAKANAVAFWHCNDESQEFWEQCIQDYDDEIKEIGMQEPKESMFTKARIGVMIVIALILLIVLSSCSTMDGMKRDIHWLTADVEHSKEK